ncbi:succinate dehydrogenase subunit 6, mitochondrial [Nymphaea colorata]|nr:succinate dehydrogenase subunit 6, mitochondrial [Nymphaea colorata]
MAEGGDSLSPSWWQRFLDEKKEYWGERLAFLENYREIYGREKPLPKWSKSDVEEFIDSDPVNGPPLKLAREAAKISAVGSVIGAVSTAGFSWKYSKSPHGALLSLGFGAVVGWTFGQEIASHWFQLYKYDTMAAQLKFFDWWESKTERRS